MNSLSRLSRTLIFICLAAILCAALVRAGAHLLIAILTPIFFFLTTVVGLSILSIDENSYSIPSETGLLIPSVNNSEW